MVWCDAVCAVKLFEYDDDEEDGIKSPQSRKPQQKVGSDVCAAHTTSQLTIEHNWWLVVVG